MKTQKLLAHFVDNYLINPTNPISVNVIGAGGTGSQILTALARMNQALIQLQHPGLCVIVYDDDHVTPANLGRQLFATAEIGLPKSVALINRINRFFGSNWKAVTEKITDNEIGSSEYGAHLTISCTDNIQSRFTIANVLTNYRKTISTSQYPLYWLDFGNNQYTGQVLLSTINKIEQPKSKKFIPIDTLSLITEEFKDLLNNVAEDNTPSCSLAEALQKQDLFINSTLASIGASLLWSMFREGVIFNRGFFLNLKSMEMRPIPIVCKQ